MTKGGASGGGKNLKKKTDGIFYERLHMGNV